MNVKVFQNEYMIRINIENFLELNSQYLKSPVFKLTNKT